MEPKNKLRITGEEGEVGSVPEVAPVGGYPSPVPDPVVSEKPQRRRFTAEYKLQILREADACKKPGPF